MNEIEQERKKKIRDYIMNYLKEKDILFQEDNVVHADKAFKANSVLRWCIDRKQKGLLSSSLAGKHFEFLDMFIADEIDLIWVKGNVKPENKNEKPE